MNEENNKKNASVMDASFLFKSKPNRIYQSPWSQPRIFMASTTRWMETM